MLKKLVKSKCFFDFGVRILRTRSKDRKIKDKEK